MCCYLGSEPTLNPHHHARSWSRTGDNIGSRRRQRTQRLAGSPVADMLPAGSRVPQANIRAVVVVVVFYLCVQLRRCHGGARSRCPPLGRVVTSQAGLLASIESRLFAPSSRLVAVLLLGEEGRSPALAAAGEEVEVGWVQREDASLIAMITGCEVPGCCRGFGVSLCILGTMDEAIQPLKTKRGRAVAWLSAWGDGATRRSRREVATTRKHRREHGCPIVSRALQRCSRKFGTELSLTLRICMHVNDLCGCV